MQATQTQSAAAANNAKIDCDVNPEMAICMPHRIVGRLF